MPITETAFNAANRILFKANIIHENLNRNSTLTADIIDLDHSGTAQASTQRTGLTTFQDVYAEPALSVPLQTIANECQTLGQGEIVTQADLTNVMLQNLAVEFGNTVFTHTQADRTNTRPLASLIAQFAPLGSNNGCAINTKTNEFYIYQPNA